MTKPKPALLRHQLFEPISRLAFATGDLVQQLTSLTTKVLRSIQKRSLLDTILYMFYELYFDFKYNVETRKTVALPDIHDIPSSVKLNSIWYQATPYYFLRQSFARIAHELKGACFLDYGCGKGRVLLLAAEFGVNVRYGVEYSESLCRSCRANLSRAQKDQNCLVICQDAADFVVPPQVNVIFLFNPFKEQTVRKVAEQIKDSLAIQPRKITILYHSSAHESLFLGIGFRKVDKICQRNPGDEVSILKYTLVQ
jgi:16S rRNA G966 N2-methylase RsmD